MFLGVDLWYREREEGVEWSGMEFHEIKGN
jgi:hypothetical protein